LEVSGGTGRMATTWFAPANFNFTVSFNDGGTHQVAVYGEQRRSR
jgi:hypothetical protein